FIVAIMAYFVMTQSDYPSRWLLEDSRFVFWRKYRKCLLIQLTPPDDYEPDSERYADHPDWMPIQKVSQHPELSPENCGFLDHNVDEWRRASTAVFQIDANVSSLLTSTFSFEGGRYDGPDGWIDYDVDPGHLFLLGGCTIFVCLILDGLFWWQRLLVLRRHGFLNVSV
ncbi:unnamed protein product, partial [Symbiodinium pilosum]